MKGVLSSEWGAAVLRDVIDMKEESVVAVEVEDGREEDVSLAVDSRGKVVYWPKRGVVPDRETEHGVRAVRDRLFAMKGVLSSLVSFKAEKSREEDFMNGTITLHSVSKSSTVGIADDKNDRDTSS